MTYGNIGPCIAAATVFNHCITASLLDYEAYRCYEGLEVVTWIEQLIFARAEAYLILKVLVTSVRVQDVTIVPKKS